MLTPAKLEAVGHFAFSMATTLSSGLLPAQALELSGPTSANPRIERAARAAAEDCANGMALADALSGDIKAWPGFVIPVLVAGERSGRLVEAFQFIRKHCERLKPAVTVVRNTWLYPLVCIVAGWIIRMGIFLGFGRVGLAWAFLCDTVLRCAGLILVVWVLGKLRPVRLVLDHVLLQLPLIRETILRLDLVLFFGTFRLAYEAGGLSVLPVFDLALSTVGNSVVRSDLARAREVLQDNGSFEDAFAQPRLVADDIKSTLATGALSGHLESSLEQVVRLQTVELEFRLELFNRLFQRLVAYGVAMSVVGTFLFCLNY